LVLCRCGSSESWQTRSALCARVPDPRTPDRSGLLVVGDNTDQNLLVTWTWTYVNSGWQARSEPSDRLVLRRLPLPAHPQAHRRCLRLLRPEVRAHGQMALRRALLLESSRACSAKEKDSRLSTGGQRQTVPVAISLDRRLAVRRGLTVRRYRRHGWSYRCSLLDRLTAQGGDALPWPTEPKAPARPRCLSGARSEPSTRSQSEVCTSRK